MSTTFQAAERWQDNRRKDGLRIERGIDGEKFVIVTAAGHAITQCPCCNLNFGSARAARLVADLVCPVLAD